MSSQVWLLGVNRRSSLNLTRAERDEIKIPGLVQQLLVEENEMGNSKNKGESGIGLMTIQVVVAPLVISCILYGVAIVVLFVERFALNNEITFVVPYPEW